MKMVKNVQLLQSCVVVKMVRKDKQGSGLLPAMIQDLTPIGLKRYTPEKKGGFSDGGLADSRSLILIQRADTPVNLVFA